jgi:hypothetical protein
LPTCPPRPPAALFAPHSLKKYDIAGDGITTRDFVTITAGAGAIEFCKGQCAQMLECEFVVTQLTKCYLKSNIQGGTYGKTGASPLTDATCVKGADNWLKFALQVSNQPAQGFAGAVPGIIPSATPLQQRRNMSVAAAAAAAGNGASGAARATAAAAAGWMLAAALLAA